MYAPESSITICILKDELFYPGEKYIVQHLLVKSNYSELPLMKLNLF